MQHQHDLKNHYSEKAMPVCQFDPKEYRDALAGMEMSDEQKDELLGVLWNIVSTFVDISWGGDTIQMFLSPEFDEAGRDSRKLVKHKENKKGKKDDK